MTHCCDDDHRITYAQDIDLSSTLQSRGANKRDASLPRSGQRSKAMTKTTTNRYLSNDELDLVSGGLPQYGEAVPGSPGLVYCPGGTTSGGDTGVYGANVTCAPTLQQQIETIVANVNAIVNPKGK